MCQKVFNRILVALLKLYLLPCLEVGAWRLLDAMK